MNIKEKKTGNRGTEDRKTEKHRRKKLKTNVDNIYLPMLSTLVIYIG